MPDAPTRMPRTPIRHSDAGRRPLTPAPPADADARLNGETSPTRLGRGRVPPFPSQFMPFQREISGMNCDRRPGFGQQTGANCDRSTEVGQRAGTNCDRNAEVGQRAGTNCDLSAGAGQQTGTNCDLSAGAG